VLEDILLFKTKRDLHEAEVVVVATEVLVGRAQG